MPQGGRRNEAFTQDRGPADRPLWGPRLGRFSPLLPDLGSSAETYTRIVVRLSDFPIFVLSMKSNLIAEFGALYYGSMTLPFAKDFPKDYMVHSNFSTSMSYSFLERQLEKHCGKKCYSSRIEAH